MARTADQIADHNRDLRKNGDLNPLPIDAHTVALLARVHTTSFDEAVTVIQQFANAVAAEAVCKAVRETHAQVIGVIDGLTTRVNADA